MVRSSARGHGADRFYVPPPMRPHRQEQQQREAATKPKPKPPAPVENRVDSNDTSSKPSVSSTPSASSSPPPFPTAGNLNGFLEATTPVVPARYFPKTAVRGWRNRDDAASMPYFILGDLWESFGEWSAYGAGVPLLLNGTDCVYQYYVPYLSAIQLYVDSSRPVLRPRPLGEESDGEAYPESTSDSSSGQEGSSSDDGEVGDMQKLRIFEYLEDEQPYKRKPLADKMSALANNFPGLRTYKSCDLLPFSWISVAWYPIYRIPTGPTLRDLDACFLTYHSLGTLSKGNGPSEFIGSWSDRNWNNAYSDSSMLEKLSLPTFGLASCLSGNGHSEFIGSWSDRNLNNASDSSMLEKLSLPILGLASYKLRSSIWISSEPHEWQLVSRLLQEADSWLRLVRVDHPDYRFFVSHSNISNR